MLVVGMCMSKYIAIYRYMNFWYILGKENTQYQHIQEEYSHVRKRGKGRKGKKEGKEKENRRRKGKRKKIEKGNGQREYKKGITGF